MQIYKKGIQVSIRFIIMLVVVFGIMSCFESNSSDSKETGDTNTIIGKWKCFAAFESFNGIDFNQIDSSEGYYVFEEDDSIKVYGNWTDYTLLQLFQYDKIGPDSLLSNYMEEDSLYTLKSFYKIINDTMDYTIEYSEKDYLKILMVPYSGSIPPTHWPDSIVLAW